MHKRSGVTRADVFIGVMIVLAIIVAVAAALRIDTWGERGDGVPADDVPDDADLGLQKLRKIDPALIRYGQTAEIPVAMEQARALAVGPDDSICVAGDREIHRYDASGQRRAEILLEGRPTCLAVGGAEHAFPGRLYVGVDHHVEVFDVKGNRQKRWDDLGEKAVLTSLAAAEHDVFVADAGNKTVWHYDTSGKLKGQIGQRDDRRGIPGFVVPSPYIDLAAGRHGLLYVANPGRLRIEAYTLNGDLELFWGKGMPTVQGFFGCCNPAHFALFANGCVVTAEKGLPRVKVYGPQGEFLCVVAGPEQLDVAAADLAVDGRDRVLFLDQQGGCIRVFQRKTPPAPAER